MATIDLQERGARQPEETERAHHDRAANVGADHHVLVIGGAGYVGNVLTRKLLARGYRVRCLDILERRSDIANGGSDQPDYRVSFEKIRSVLGFTPRYSVADSVSKLRNAIGWGLFSDVDERPSFYANQVICA